MTVTKDNFNQIVEIAATLATNSEYIEANNLANRAFDCYRELDEAETFDLNIGKLCLILCYTDWRTADDDKNYATLAEQLNTNTYWSDDLYEHEATTINAGCLREKALAYTQLAIHYETCPLSEHYTDYALTYIDKAISQYEEIMQSDPDIYPSYMYAKIKKATILRLKSNKMARNYAISLFGEELSQQDKDSLMEVYNGSTDVLFDDYFAKKPIMLVETMTDINDDLKDEVLDDLLAKNAEPGNDDLYWWFFTHKIAPAERKKILFVENIEDAANNDFDKIPWVFTLDRYPFDLEFDTEEEPTAGVYKIDAADTGRYHKI